MPIVGLISGDLNTRHGAAHYSLRLAQGLQQTGCEVRAVASHNSDTDYAFPVAAILPALVPADRGVLPRSLTLTHRARALLQGCDVIQCTAEHFAPLAVAVGKALNRPVVLTLYGTYANLPRMRRFPVGAIYRGAFMRAEIVCISRYTERITHEVLPRARTRVIPNGIDAPPVAHLPALENRPAGQLILSTGGIKPRKGTIHTVRAMAHIRQSYPDAHLVIVGNPRESSAYTQSVRAEIERLHLHDAVTFAGFVPEDELQAWYHTADVFVLPSMNHGYSFEGFGLVHLEAGLAGLPVIGTRDCGIEDAINDGETGLLVSQTHIDDELPQAIMRLLGSAPLRQMMGENGRTWANRHTWRATAQHYLALYDSLMRERSTRR